MRSRASPRLSDSGLDAAQFLRQILLSLAQLIKALRVHPKLRSGSEESLQADSRIGSDSSFLRATVYFSLNDSRLFLRHERCLTPIENKLAIGR